MKEFKKNSRKMTNENQCTEHQCPNCWGVSEYNGEARVLKLSEQSRTKGQIGWVMDYVGKHLYA